MNEFRCLQVQRSEDGTISTRLESCSVQELASGEVRIAVAYSSLNYKDAMAASGHSGLVKNFPHVPGIDAAGTVLESRDDRFQPGDEVISTGHQQGVERWGGWAEILDTPADWLVPLPDGLTMESAMVLGTAGFTAAQCMQAILHHNVSPDQGEVILTGATGGVGSVCLMLLAKLGFSVVAVTGKEDQHEWLKELGAHQVADRSLLEDARKRPLLSARYAAGIDTVGGEPLAVMLKSIQHRGCVACCGMVAGTELSTTVLPFILRGLALYGIDSAWCPDDQRKQIWNRLAVDWRLPKLDALKRVVALEQLPESVEKILAGENVGRVVVDLRE